MKRLFILIGLFFNIVLITFIIFLYNGYNIKMDNLENKLGDMEYEEYVSNLDNDKQMIIDGIEVIVGYDLDGVNNYNDIKEVLNDKYDSLVEENKQLVKKRDDLKEQYNVLKDTYDEILEEENKKNSFMIENVGRINQYSQGYPTGCESAALTNLLNYWGVSVRMSDVVNLLPKGALPYYESGVRYGGNPYIEFVGHPSTSSSYGVYEKPIVQVANKLKPGVIDGTGMSLNDVLNLVKSERPVMVWVSMNMAVPYIGSSWIYKPTGEKINWMSNEHALVVIGYNLSQVIVTDSLNGSIRYYDKKVFENRYNTYGKRAVYY